MVATTLLVATVGREQISPAPAAESDPSWVQLESAKKGMALLAVVVEFLVVQVAVKISARAAVLGWSHRGGNLVVVVVEK